MPSRPSRPVLFAFAVFVLLGGANAIGVRIVVEELPPMSAAAMRFGTAGLVLAALVALLRRPLPRGRALLGTVLFGTFATGLAYMFLYEALRSAPAGTTMLVLAIVPLLTVLLSALQGTERLQRGTLGGALLAGAGILVVAADQLALEVPPAAILLLLAGALCIAESGVVAKRFPPGDPVPANAIGMLIGSGILAVAALAAGEPFVLPAAADTWLAMLFLIGPGSVGLFVLVLYVLARWTASATSYAFLLFPLVAIALGALLLAEPVRPSFLVGGAIVLVGVYVGAIRQPSEPEAAAAPLPPPSGPAIRR